MYLCICYSAFQFKSLSIRNQLIRLVAQSKVGKLSQSFLNHRLQSWRRSSALFIEPEKISVSARTAARNLGILQYQSYLELIIPSHLTHLSYLRVGCAVGAFLYLGNFEVDNRTQEKKTFAVCEFDWECQSHLCNWDFHFMLILVILF